MQSLLIRLFEILAGLQTILFHLPLQISNRMNIHQFVQNYQHNACIILEIVLLLSYTYYRLFIPIIKKRREPDSASDSEASPNAVLVDTSLSPRLNASIDSFLLTRYFGEISESRIKKSTLPYVVGFYPTILTLGIASKLALLALNRMVLCLSVYPLMLLCFIQL